MQVIGQMYISYEKLHFYANHMYENPGRAVVFPLHASDAFAPAFLRKDLQFRQAQLDLISMEMKKRQN